MYLNQLTAKLPDLLALLLHLNIDMEDVDLEQGRTHTQTQTHTHTNHKSDDHHVNTLWCCVRLTEGTEQGY